MGCWKQSHAKGFARQRSHTAEQYRQNSYEASWGPNGLIFTNRDAGNFLAGRVSEMMGIPWRVAEAGFGAFNAASNDGSSLMWKTLENILTRTTPQKDNQLKYKEYKASADLQKMGYYNK